MGTFSDLSEIKELNLSIKLKEEWQGLHFGDPSYSASFLVIENRIVYINFSGKTSRETIKKTFDFLNEKVLPSINNLKNYILFENVANIVSGSSGSRQEFFKHHSTDTRIDAIAIIGLAKTFSIIIKLIKFIHKPRVPLNNVEDFIKAMEFLKNENISLFSDPKILSTIDKSNIQDNILHFNDSVFNINPSKLKENVWNLSEYISSLTWEEDFGNYKIPTEESHIFRPIYEALSLVKRDFSYILQEKNAEAELRKKTLWEIEKQNLTLSEQLNYNKLRADMFKIAVDDSKDEKELINRILELAGPVTGACRVNYNILKENNDMECLISWCQEHVTSSKGMVVPALVVRNFVKDDVVVVNKDDALKFVPSALRKVVFTVASKILDKLSINTIIISPYLVNNRSEGAIELQYCDNNPKAKNISENDKEIVRDIANIIGIKIEQKRQKDAMKEKENELIISQRMESIGTLTGGIAHDFNNMLTPVSGFADLLLEDEEDQLKREYLRRIKSIVAKSAGLTQKLLGFGRRGKT